MIHVRFITHLVLILEFRNKTLADRLYTVRIGTVELTKFSDLRRRRFIQHDAFLLVFHVLNACCWEEIDTFVRVYIINYRPRKSFATAALTNVLEKDPNCRRRGGPECRDWFENFLVLRDRVPHALLQR